MEKVGKKTFYFSFCVCVLLLLFHGSVPSNKMCRMLIFMLILLLKLSD